MGHQRLVRGQHVVIMDVGALKEYCKRLSVLYVPNKNDHIIKEAKYAA